MQRTPAAPLLAIAAALALSCAAQAQMAGMPGMNMAAAAPAPAAGASASSCVQNPTTRNCTDYEYPESSIKADMAELCEEMPYMVGCSIQHECEAGRASGPYCKPMSILADLCLDMGGMSGCINYKKLCLNLRSVVKQCSDAPAVPRVLHTMQTRDDIQSMCGSHYMDGCQDCTGTGFSNCPKPLDTLSRLCLGMPGMSECRNHDAFCNAAGSGFGPFCSAPSDGSSVPPMRMYFHTGTYDIILFRGWVPVTGWQYALSCLAIIAMGIVVQGIRALRAVTEVRWQRQLFCDPNSCGSETSVTALTGGGNKLSRGGHVRAQLMRNAIRAAFTVVTATLEFMLMLVAMTFNVGLFVCVIAGLALGTLMFGHILAAEPNVGYDGQGHGTDGNPALFAATHSAAANAGCGCSS